MLRTTAHANCQTTMNTRCIFPKSARIHSALISIRMKCLDKEQNGCNTQDQFLVGRIRSTARTHPTVSSTSVHLCPRLHAKQFPSISNGLQQPTRVICPRCEPRDLFDCSLKDTTAIQTTCGDLRSWLTRIDKSELTGLFKVLIYQIAILTRVLWPLPYVNYGNSGEQDQYPSAKVAWLDKEL